MKRLKENSKKQHILIIGAGIIGKFNALQLSKLGYKITITDPTEHKNSSNAALGLLMGNMYQKRTGKSWELRRQSLELWPKWIKFLKEFNKELDIEKPLIQLTTNEEKFQKLEKFVLDINDPELKVLKKDSTFIRNINTVFKTNDIKGIISLKDGRIDPTSLLKTIDIYLKSKKVNFLKDEIIKVTQLSQQWISTTKKNIEIKTDAVILCNSLNALNLIDYKTHNIQLKAVLGQAMEVKIDDKTINFLSLPKHFNINGTNIIPIGSNKIIIGSTDEYNINPEEKFFEKLTDFIEIRPKWLSKEKISRKWFGIRSRPVGEPSPIMRKLEEGLILCTGFYKNGILLAPACAKWVSEKIEGEFC